MTGIVSDFLAEHANEARDTRGGPDRRDRRRLRGGFDPFRERRRHAARGGRAHFLEGGPLWTVSLYHDEGSVPRYSYMFLAGSVILFAIHLPLLDIAERKRKDFLLRWARLVRTGVMGSGGRREEVGA